MKVVYVSGKYRDERGIWFVRKNIQLAEGIAVDLWQMGYAVICPHLNTAMMEGPLDDPIILAGDCELVRRSDALVVCPNWRTSIGTRVEWDAAFQAQKPIFYWENPEHHLALKEWVNGKYDIAAHVQRQLKHSSIEDWFAADAVEEIYVARCA